jgi:hypothetical protein
MKAFSDHTLHLLRLQGRWKSPRAAEAQGCDAQDEREAHV